MIGVDVGGTRIKIGTVLYDGNLLDLLHDQQRNWKPRYLKKFPVLERSSIGASSLSSGWDGLARGLPSVLNELYFENSANISSSHWYNSL